MPLTDTLTNLITNRQHHQIGVDFPSHSIISSLRARSERVEARRSDIFARYEPKLQAFLDFVLGQYVKQGVGELDQEKLGNLLELKYHTVADAAIQLGGVPVIRDTFIGFQEYLYQRSGDTG